MFKDAKNTKLIPTYAEIIDSHEVRNAFCLIMGLSATLKTFYCYPQQKGTVNDFRFFSKNNEQEFAFIPNKKWLLFYFRKPALEKSKYSFNTLKEIFESANNIKQRGEWTVRLYSINDVNHLWKYLDLK